MKRDMNGISGGLAIEVIDLHKSFGKTQAVNGVNLQVPQGGVYGLLGPNGAGKTTVIRILATLIRPDSGSASILGHDIIDDSAKVRSKVSLTGQFASVDDDLSGTENLILLTRLHGYSKAGAKSRTEELLAAFGLSAAANRQVRTYSGGMRRRLDIAASIVVKPDLLFLDEPTTGLDPRSRNQVWDIIRALVREGTTVLLTTQYLDEADHLANRIAVIDYGKVIAEGTPGQLKSSVGTGVLRIRLQLAEQRKKAGEVLRQALVPDLHLESDPHELTAKVESIEHSTSILTELTRADIHIEGYSLGQPSLDEVFLSLTGQTTLEKQEQMKKNKGI